MLFFFKQKTAYEMRISDWSSDVCSSDLLASARPLHHPRRRGRGCAAGGGDPPFRIWPRPDRDRPRIRSDGDEIGRASCRERVCQYVSISVVAVSLKNTTINKSN